MRFIPKEWKVFVISLLLTLFVQKSDVGCENIELEYAKSNRNPEGIFVDIYKLCI